MTSDHTLRQFTLQELAELTESSLIGDPDLKISGFADLESADIGDASFFANPRYLKAMERSAAGVVIVPEGTVVDSDRNFLVSEDPSRAFQRVIEAFVAARPLSAFQGVHPRAVVADSAILGDEVQIGPCAVIDASVTIGRGTIIAPNVTICKGVTIGEECLIKPGVVIEEGCILGDRVVLQPGCIIGGCGFGFTTDKNHKHQKLQQLGNVILEDDVEVGCNTTIDRARFKSTRIKRGTKIDNLVQIAHGVTLGQDNIIVGLSGIAGSVTTGDRVTVAGQVGMVGHITIADDVTFGARSGVIKSVKRAGIYLGMPASPANEQVRREVYLRNIDKYVATLKDLGKRLTKLEAHAER